MSELHNTNLAYSFEGNEVSGCRLLTLALLPVFLVLVDSKKCFIGSGKGLLTFTEEWGAIDPIGGTRNTNLDSNLAHWQPILSRAPGMVALCSSETQE